MCTFIRELSDTWKRLFVYQMNVVVSSSLLELFETCHIDVSDLYLSECVHILGNCLMHEESSYECGF